MRPLAAGKPEIFAILISSQLLTGAAQNRRLALTANILSRDSDGAVPVAARDIKGGDLA